MLAIVFVVTHLGGAALLSPKLGAPGIALSFSMGSWINTLLLGFFLWRQKLLLWEKYWGKSVLQILLISLLMGLSLLLIQWILSPLPSSWGNDVLRLLVQMILGVTLVLILGFRWQLIPYAPLRNQALRTLRKTRAAFLRP